MTSEIPAPLGTIIYFHGPYWPVEGAYLANLSTFREGFATLGYEATENPEYQPNLEKIAFYGHGDRVNHAARQLANGNWTSKLGEDVDIEHTLRGLESVYGEVIAVLARQSELEA